MIRNSHALLAFEHRDAAVLSIELGLFLGEQAGVFLASTAALKLGWAELPPGRTAVQLYGGSILTGIGFTMGLFVGTLAFYDQRSLGQIRLAVLAVAALTALVASTFLWSAKPGRDEY